MKTFIEYLILFCILFFASLGFAYYRGISREKWELNSPFLPIQEKDAYLEIQNPNRPTIHYFWAIWCTVCKVNEPFLKASIKTLNPKNIHFVSWEEGSSPQEKVLQYIQENQIPYPVALATPQLLSQAKVQGFPTTIFTDSQGRVRFVDTGLLTPIGFWIRIFFLENEF